MKRVFTFPGQGSQSIGMGKDLADNFSSARLVFQEVDDTLNQKLSALMWEGSEEDLQRTTNAQPALMAVSIAVLHVIEELGYTLHDIAHYAAGHSLGEYSALCAAQSLSLRDTAKLLRIRGDAMQEAVPEGKGSMAAILGLSFEEVSSLVSEVESDLGDEVCEIANDNADGQIVLSGSVQGVDKAIMLAKEKGAKRALLLPVSAPFHCSMMKPARDVMADALDHVDFKKPSVPVLTNISAQPQQDPDQLKAHLVEQVTGSVRWRESLSWLNQKGQVESYIEAGSGKVLSGLAKRMAKGAQILSLQKSEDIESFVKSL